MLLGFRFWAHFAAFRSSSLVQAMAASSNKPNRRASSNVNSNQRGAKTGQKKKLRRKHRVLCYGDSLTAGTTSEDYVPYPYAPHLEEMLQDDNVVVRHVGLPGWTTSSMLEQLDGPAGLKTAVQAIQMPPLSLVVILAGTNDLGFGDASVDDITNNLLQLHRIAWECGVPRTLAVGVPPSGYQALNKAARQVVNEVNGRLRETSEGCTMAYTPFPFPFEEGGEDWDEDGLHFTPIGYRRLGESLAPVVRRILQELEASAESRTA
jgi:lysophospholipase L1-like esterase